MSIEAMKQALEALERSVATCFDQYAHQQVMSQSDHFINQSITSLRQAIREEALRNVQRLGQEIEEEAEKQEPVCAMCKSTHGKWSWMCSRCLLIHDKQPKREWVGLTDEETQTCWDKAVNTIAPQYSIVRAIEAKLKEKNT